MSYEAMITALVKGFMPIVSGDAIVKAANDIEGLNVNETGNVTSLDRPGDVVLGELYDKYKSMGGGIAKMFAKKAIKPIADGNPQLIIPDELR